MHLLVRRIKLGTMEETEIRALKITPYQVKKITKLLQKEVSINDLLKVFETEWGFDIFKDYRERLLTACYQVERYYKCFQEAENKLSELKNELSDYKKTFTKIKEICRSFTEK